MEPKEKQKLIMMVALAFAAYKILPAALKLKGMFLFGGLAYAAYKNSLLGQVTQLAHPIGLSGVGYGRRWN